jgi:hypothetical protein
MAGAGEVAAAGGGVGLGWGGAEVGEGTGVDVSEPQAARIRARSKRHNHSLFLDITHSSWYVFGCPIIPDVGRAVYLSRFSLKLFCSLEMWYNGAHVEAQGDD